MSAGNLDPSFQLTQGQKELYLTNSTKSVDKEELFQPNSKPYNLTYGEWTAEVVAMGLLNPKGSKSCI